MSKDKNVYAVVLAGGSGTRFWPKSKKLRPKQLCTLGDSDLTMIEKTLNRLDGFIPASHRMVITHQMQMVGTKEIIGKNDSVKTMMGEPCAKNTAAALALGAFEIKSKLAPNEDAFMVSLHADHVIADTKGFQNTITKALESADQGKIVLIGIPPAYPETGYGYIEKSDSFDKHSFEVASFREKPNHELAQSYVESGNFLWNSGLFVWKVSTILSELEKWLPETYSKLKNLFGESSFEQLDPAQVEQVYNDLESIAIDHAVLEKTDLNVVIPAMFDWQDVGSWDALARCFSVDKQGNYIKADSFILDSHNITVDSEDTFVSVVGLDDVVVVQSGSSILVCHKDRAQDVKKVVAYLKEQKRDDLI